MSSSSSSTHQQGVPPPTPSEARYIEVQNSPEFQELRKKFRGWVIPVTIAALAWYFLYVFLAAYATGFMGTKVFGNINIGLILGFSQFLTTFAVTGAYIRYADRTLDPMSSRIRHEMEEKGLL